jgi:hypothetical protein
METSMMETGKKEELMEKVSNIRTYRNLSI